MDARMLEINEKKINRHQTEFKKHSSSDIFTVEEDRMSIGEIRDAGMAMTTTAARILTISFVTEMFITVDERWFRTYVMHVWFWKRLRHLNYSIRRS